MRTYYTSTIINAIESKTEASPSYLFPVLPMLIMLFLGLWIDKLKSM